MLDKKLELVDFKIKSLTFEVRYAPAYLLWDRSGALWSNLEQIWPDLQTVETGPNLTSFRVGENFQLQVELKKSHITAFNTKINDIFDPFETFLLIVRKTLEISTYSRLCFSIINEKKYK